MGLFRLHYLELSSTYAGIKKYDMAEQKQFGVKNYLFAYLNKSAIGSSLLPVVVSVKAVEGEGAFALVWGLRLTSLKKKKNKLACTPPVRETRR
ncbi:hypothetical protein MKW98_030964 [Papaver atlanticum]|uniref:Uncharacterized protein n=1 Tax=Papaver atlanticum TaxID=357466 RepID=A0AAD4S6P7_9MAGN|nr:hypothetical protein MKW98_030964 [Papaver atlanticum]